MNEVIKNYVAGSGIRIVEIGIPEGAIAHRYARVLNGVVQTVVESHIDPDGVGPEWVACGDAGPGWTYDGTNFAAPVPPPTPVDPCEWLIDLGPFYDRFGTAKMAVLTSADSGVKAIVSDLSIRKWVDLKRADVASALAYIGSVVPVVTSTLQDAILNTPVTSIENLALRKLYFK